MNKKHMTKFQSYITVLEELKNKIRQAQYGDYLSVNKEMIFLYWDNWDIGKTIIEQQKNQGWGAKVIDCLSSDLREAFPDWFY